MKADEEGDFIVDDPENLGRFARILRASASPLVNTAASARWRGRVVGDKLFQQFARLAGKPLKRLGSRCGAYHRAEATVLMKGLIDLRRSLPESSLLKHSAPGTCGRSFYRRDAKSAEICCPVVFSAFFASLRFIRHIRCGRCFATLRNAHAKGCMAPLIEPHA